MDLKNKTVIVTGASSGIGKACAEELAKHGVNLVLAARSYESLQELANQLQEKNGIKALAVSSDVSKQEDCKRLIAQAIKTFGQIDILINNAGISMRALFIDLDLIVLQRLMDVNFWGAVYCTKYALPELLKQQGSVVGVSSIAGYCGLPGRTGYTASKFALNGFLASLRVENLKTGLHVMTVAPGFTASNIRHVALNESGFPQGESSMDENKMMTAQTAASLIIKGIIQRKQTLTLTKQGKLTLLLSKFLPRTLNKLIYKHFTKEQPPLFT